MMGGDFGAMGWGAGIGLGWVFMALCSVLLIAGTVWLVLTLTRQAGSPQAATRSSALGVLEERLARGEIDADEFKARKSAIGGAS